MNFNGIINRNVDLSYINFFMQSSRKNIPYIAGAVLVVLLGIISFYAVPGLIGSNLQGKLGGKVFDSKNLMPVCPSYSVMPVIVPSASFSGGMATPSVSKTVAVFDIQAQGDFVVNALKFKKVGNNNPDKNVTDFSLYLNGNLVSSAVSQNSSDVVFNQWTTAHPVLGAGFFVQAGVTSVITVMADTTNVKTGTNGPVNFSLDIPGISCGDGGLTWSFVQGQNPPKIGLKVSKSYPVKSAVLYY